MSSESDIGEHLVPKASRPQTPGPGYGVPESDEGMVPWNRVDQRLGEARTYWIATSGPEGRPHAVPTWGVWIDLTFYTEGGGRKVRNLRANPSVVLHLESGEDVVIVEGETTEISRPQRALFDRIDAAYAAKYDYKPSDNLSGPEDVPYLEGGLFAVRPRVIFAWSQFPADVTRFTMSS